MKALTIRQPWAWAIARGYKPIENRVWNTNYRGPLAVHAALRWDEPAVDAVRFVRDLAREQGSTLPERLADDLPMSGTGCVVAVAELVGVCCVALDGAPCDCGPWAMPGQHHWRLTHVQPLAESLPMRGRLGLWDLTLPATPSPGGATDGE
jgi:hypothetical protein